MVDGGHYIGERFTGAGTSGEHVVVPRTRNAHRLGLVLVQQDRLPLIMYVGALVLPENAPTLRVQYTLVYQ